MWNYLKRRNKPNGSIIIYGMGVVAVTHGGFWGFVAAMVLFFGSAIFDLVTDPNTK